MGGNPPVPADLNWVKERAACTLGQFFKELELGVRADVDKINLLIQPGVMLKFSVVKHDNRFSVICEVNGLTSHAVDFTLSENEIVVSENQETKFSGTLTLTNSGACKLKVHDKLHGKINDEELEQWQVRRKALESLFFDENRGRYIVA
jgi:hypothetical protein